MFDTTAAATSLGPTPFVFLPVRERVEGPAFSRVFQTLASLLVAGCIGWLARLWMVGAVGAGSWLIWAGGVLMVWTWVWILRSRTSVSGVALEQKWIWDKRMPVADLAYAKVIRVPGLDWLVAPRLYVRSLTGKFLVFYGATPELVGEFSRIALEVGRFRRG